MQSTRKPISASERPLLITKIKSYTKSDDFVKVTLLVSKSVIKILFKKQLQREIELSEIDAVTYSTTSSQFIIHVKNDIDERFSSIKHRQDILEMVLYLLTITGGSSSSKIKFFKLVDSNLSAFVTSEEDLEDGHILRPELRFMTLMDYKRFLNLIRETSTYEPGSKRISKSKKVTHDDFELLKLLGKGAHGKVLLCSRKGRSTPLYAMKILKKQHIIDANQLEHTIAEKLILSNVNHPFLVSMKYTFQTESKLYFVMEFMSGGELFQHLKRVGKFSEIQTKFFCACLVMALGHLHNSNYIYRDLKPENILLDSRGYVKLSDFGLAKEVHVSDLAKTFCGTPEYLAPEVILNKGCNRPADWWSLGILVFEMLFGAPPFYSTDVQEMYKKTILKGLRFPANSGVTDLALDFVSGLLVKDPKERLGSVADSLEVMNHPWFQDINWSNLLAKKIDPPYDPTRANWEVNFDPEFITQEARDSRCEVNQSLLFEYRKKFERFDFETNLEKEEIGKRKSSASSLGRFFHDEMLQKKVLGHSATPIGDLGDEQEGKTVIGNGRAGVGVKRAYGSLENTPSVFDAFLGFKNGNEETKIRTSKSLLGSKNFEDKLKSLDVNFGTKNKSMFQISEENQCEESSPTKLFETASGLGGNSSGHIHSLKDVYTMVGNLTDQGVKL